MAKAAATPAKKVRIEKRIEVVKEPIKLPFTDIKELSKPSVFKAYIDMIFGSLPEDFQGHPNNLSKRIGGLREDLKYKFQLVNVVAQARNIIPTLPLAGTYISHIEMLQTLGNKINSVSPSLNTTYAEWRHVKEINAQIFSRQDDGRYLFYVLTPDNMIEVEREVEYEVEEIDPEEDNTSTDPNKGGE